MKKKIFLILIYVLELGVLIIHGIPALADVKALAFLVGTGSVLVSAFTGLSKLVQLGRVISSEYLLAFLGMIIFNLIFAGVYYLIFGILTVVLRKNNEKKRREIVPPYELTNLEKEQLDYHNYMAKKPWRIYVSEIVPAALIVLFVFARFDATLSRELESDIAGTITLSPAIEYGLDSVLGSGVTHSVFTAILKPYVAFMNHAFSTAPWVEYLVLGLGGILILVVWFFIFLLIGKLSASSRARRKAKKAKKNYIEKMEKEEYRLRQKYKDETSLKADEFLSIVEEEQNDTADAIASINAEDAPRDNAKENARKRAYIEEIGYGVTDLGVTDEKEEVTKPITEREIRYISDEDVDIILEEEPVIEVVEEEEENAPSENGEDEIFFEKYEPDDNPEENEEIPVEVPADVEHLIAETIDTENAVVTVPEESQTEAAEEPVTESISEEPPSAETPSDNTLSEESAEPAEEAETTEEITEAPEIPAAPEIPEETSSEEETPPLEESPSEPVNEETPSEPVSEESPSSEDSPISEETPSEEETPVSPAVPEEPVSPVSEETPASEDSPEKETSPLEEPSPETPEEQESEPENEETPKEEIINDKNAPESDITKEKETEEKNMDEKVIEQPVEKNDPFAGNRGHKEAGTGDKKVPFFKELQAQKAAEQTAVAEETPAETVPAAPKKKDPFAGNRGHKEAGTGAKKVPSFKELQAQKAAEAAPATPKKKDPFAGNRGRKPAGSGAKKVPSFKEQKENK